MPCYATNEDTCTALLFFKAKGICNAEAIWKKIIIKSDHKCISGFLLCNPLDQDKSPSLGSFFIQTGCGWAASSFWKRFYCHLKFIFTGRACLTVPAYHVTGSAPNLERGESIDWLTIYGRLQSTMSSSKWRLVEIYLKLHIVLVTENAGSGLDSARNLDPDPVIPDP